MLDIAIMIEGQNGLTWPRWQSIAMIVEELGFAGLYRSDHYTNSNPPDKESLELWVSLTWLASNTRRIEFGPLVTPVSFRHPTMTARMAAAVDDLSSGRLVLGLGAGWQEREHTNYGWQLLEIKGRMDRFEEGIQVIKHLLQNDSPLSFRGSFYQLNEAVLLPHPSRPGGPPILIGGNGRNRTIGLAAKYAQQWNALFLLPDAFKQLNQRLDNKILTEGRAPESVKRSMMTGLEFGISDQQVREKVELRTKGRFSPNELRQRSVVVGTPNEVVNQLGILAEAGVQRVMLQWLNLDDLEGLENFGNLVVPQLKS